MILDDKVELRINSSNIKRFPDNKVGDIVSIPPQELTKGSHVKVNVKCDICGSEKCIKWNSYIKNYSNGDWLCRKCKSKKNNQEKYGVDNVFQLENVKDKIRKTNINKYGVDNPSKSDIIKEKRKNTNLSKYGSEYFMGTEDFKKKSMESLIDKYGVDNISKSKSIKLTKNIKWLEKSDSDKYDILKKRMETNIDRYGYRHNFEDIETIKNTNMIKYGVDNPSKSDSIIKKIRNSNINTSHDRMLSEIDNLIGIDGNIFNINCDICDSDFNINRVLFYKRREMGNIICINCNPISKNISSIELEVFNYVRSLYQGDVISNDRKVLDGKELDIYLPEIKLAIEVNGIYWHSELYRDRYYHYDKFKGCSNKGINLFQIYEDDWKYRKDIVKSMIFNKLNLTTNRVYARKCEVRIIEDVSIVREFLDDNHLQGSVNSSIKIGLYYEDELVSLMTLIRVNNTTFNLNRFCNKKYYSIVGGFTKILKFFTRNNPGISIETFSDNDYSYGELYENNGFIKIYDLRPDYSYVIGDMREHKFNYRKDKIFKMFGNVDMDKSEHELMLENQIYRIYDSGKVKWKLI